MQTGFTLAQLADPDTAQAESILRSCVHCGFCLATCPTYVLLGNELDSPRGRIYLIKNMLETEAAPSAEVVRHVDRCLSCLSCATTCPSGVDYGRLIDHARHRIEASYRRPLADRLLRRLLAGVLPWPRRFRLALRAARWVRPLRRVLPARLRPLLAMAPAKLAPPSVVAVPGRVFPAEGVRRKRVALFAGCVQPVIGSEINEATIRLLTRHGCEVVLPRGAGCCGALAHHMGQDATGFARANVDAWMREFEGAGLDAIVINTSGCGTTLKDYGFLLRDDPAYAPKAAALAALALDVTELMTELGLSVPERPGGQRVAYHAACSLQHGQRILDQPKALLAAAGFVVAEIGEGHLCCGSAGTYNLLQPEIATRLRDRKIGHIARTGASMVAAGNLGCMVQIQSGTALPVLHTVQLLDWATGGPKPASVPD